MSSPWSPPAPYREPSFAAIARAHDAFVDGDPRGLPLTGIRDVVRESWHRSRLRRIGADGLPRLELTDEQLRAHRDAHPLSGAIALIRTLLIPGDDAHSGVAVAVGDAAGRLLWVEGDRRVRSLLGDTGFVPGANWSEGAVGTAAPGTALALDRSVQIRGAEHYNRLVQRWSCTAAPVHDPETRRVIGVIDVTGGEQVVTAQAQLLVDATARAVEGELLLARLRERDASPSSADRPPHGVGRASARRPAPGAARVRLRVLGRDRAALEIAADGHETVSVLSARHAELMLMLATHAQGVSAERLAELVYGDASASVTLRAEIVRLRRVLHQACPAVRLESRPYRLDPPVETDAHEVLSLLDRGAHRVALAAYRGDALPDSTAPGVAEFRDAVRIALREALLADARIDVLLAFADTDTGSEDAELLRLCLEMLPPRSPRRAGLVARLARLEA